MGIVYQQRVYQNCKQTTFDEVKPRLVDGLGVDKASSMTQLMSDATVKLLSVHVFALRKQIAWCYCVKCMRQNFANFFLFFVALFTHLICAGNHCILLLSPSVNEFQNRLRFVEVALKQISSA